MSLSNELQAVNLQLEDATLMELEELLYDRIHVEFSGAQILFCHSGTIYFSIFLVLLSSNGVHGLSKIFCCRGRLEISQKEERFRVSLFTKDTSNYDHIMQYKARVSSVTEVLPNSV